MHVTTPNSGDEPVVNPFEDIAARLETIAAPMSENDGVRGFNDLYLDVTRAVGIEFADGRFEDSAFFARLAPIFSNLYFEAVEAAGAKRAIPRVWVPLFDKRFDTGIAALQFAIAGMNAHINHDLSLALVAATRELGYDLRLDTPHHRDHLRVNTTLTRVMGEVKERFESEMVQKVDWALGTIDDLFASWSIERARDNAWTQAQMLVALEHQPSLRDQYLLTLSRTVGLASRTLLVRTG